MNDTRSKKKKRRQRNGLIEIVNGLLTMLILLMLAVGVLMLFGIQQFYAEGPLAGDAEFSVDTGSGINATAEKLAGQGLVSNSWIFRFGAIAKRQDSGLRKGYYAIPAGASMADILKILTEGQAIQYNVTFPEGYTSWQVVERLKTVANLSGEIAAVPAEGTLLPDTYSFERDASRQSVLDQMSAAMQLRLAEVWETRATGLPVESPELLAVLASIVEKETGIASERPQVAAVFINRLNRGMRLQSDPTIIYGITNGRGPLGRGLKRSEIETETPYNTYQIDGLPVGPIANPGIDALRAAANPAETDALYFVAATTNPADGHLFAATYAEHQENVAGFREAERLAAEAEAQAGADAARDALEAEAAAASGDGTAAAQ